MKRERLKIIGALLLMLIIIGIPKSDTRREPLEKALPLPHKETIEKIDPYSVPPAPDLTLPREALKKNKSVSAPSLTPEEIKTLQLTDFNAYVRYKAKQIDPERNEGLTEEEIIRLRIAPKLKEYLEKNSETKPK